MENPYPPISHSQVKKVDAIVVLGGMINNLSLYNNRIELGDSADRLTDAILLYKKNKAAKIIITGGSGILFYQKNPESFQAKKFLMAMGIAEESILIETESRNTAENAIYTAKILNQKQWKKIILITSAFHMKRSEALFRKQGLAVLPFPTDYRSLKPEFSWDALIPSTGALDTSTIAIKEWMGIIAYKIKGYL